MKQKLTAICGLNCKECGAYIAYQNNDDDLRIKTAREWTAQFGHNFSPKDINCVGCCVKEGIHGGYCYACPLRSCALSKNVDNCYICSEFQDCKTVKEFESHSGMKLSDNFKED